MQSGLRQLTPREQAIINKYSSRHGQVRGLGLPIADVDGAIGNPLLRVPTLTRLAERGTISAQELAAGERFHDLFQRAGLDGLRAADLSRAPAAGGAAFGTPPGHERCREHIAAAIAALGGNASVAASIS